MIKTGGMLSWSRFNYLCGRLLVGVADRSLLLIIAGILLHYGPLRSASGLSVPTLHIFRTIDPRLAGLDVMGGLAAYIAVGYPLVLTFVLWSGYFLFNVLTKGRTPGMEWFDLVYVSPEGKQVSRMRILLCYILSFFSSLSVIGMLWVLFDRRGTLPEVLSKVRVVHSGRPLGMW
jgi:uncharacterized RDD family membrane protein YckC